MVVLTVGSAVVVIVVVVDHHVLVDQTSPKLVTASSFDSSDSDKDCHG